MFILGLPGSPHFSPQMQLNNTHIGANNPETSLKTGRINSATRCREERREGKDSGVPAGLDTRGRKAGTMGKQRDEKQTTTLGSLQGEDELP